MDEHYEPPWEVGNLAFDDRGQVTAITDGHGRLVALVHGSDERQSQANARRIIACVNVLEGITNEEIRAFSRLSWKRLPWSS